MTEAVAFIAGEQASNGSFMGHNSASLTSFRSSEHYPTTFFTSLIIWCLRGVPGTEALRQKAATFLLQEVNQYGSWNYWQRGSDIARRHPYPDDLDDTACALMALHSFDASLVDGAALAHVAKLLISTEVAPGGPYRTWLINPEAARWQDVDIVVNANVGGLLALHDTTLPGLNQFVDTAIAGNELTSPYYIGSVPTLYFLSRWYQGPRLGSLRKLVSQALPAATGNSLHLALLLSAARNLHLPDRASTAARKQLLALCQDGHWPAEALYFGLRHDTRPYFAGSAALTTAFALEALSGEHSTPVKAKGTTRRNDAVPRAAIKASQSLPTELAASYKKLVTHVMARDSDQQISGMASLTAAAYGHKIEAKVQDHLNLGSLNGWIAYSLYDDFLDGEGRPEQLGSAHYALRQSTYHFGQALPASPQFSTLINTAFATMDAANLWEVTHARATRQKDTLRYSLPAYKDYAQLAQRSWGHTLAASGALLASNDKNDQQSRRLQSFFKHFLIARQLNDDAHDWEADLEQGHLSAVVCLLLREHGATKTINRKTQLSALRQTFWQVTITQVSDSIIEHAAAARQAVSESNLARPDIFLSWLEPLEAAARQAVTTSHETRNFITAYQR